MEQQIIEWLAGIVEAEDNRGRYFEQIKTVRRIDGARVVDAVVEEDRQNVYDYITGELIETLPHSEWDDNWVSLDYLKDEAWDAFPDPQPSEDLMNLVNLDLDADEAREELRRWVL